MNRTPQTICLVALFLIGVTLQADARQQTRQFHVGTTVQAYAHSTLKQPSQLILANKDVNLGYVLVPNGANPSGTQISLTTNDRAGYTLVFQVAASFQPLLTSIQVFGLPTTVVLPPGGGQVTMPYAGGSATLSLSYRFNLVGKVKDGTYAWPLTIVSHAN